ncbi:MAG TPA: sugar phosphate isomerase/epimerase [Vicinamibacterales bacterium]
MAPGRTVARLIPSTTSHKREPVETTLEVFARLGWRDLDLNLWPFIEEGESIETAADALSRNGQRAVMISGGWCDFFEPAPAIEDTFTSVARQVGFARRLGATHVRLFFGRLATADYSRARFDLVCRHLRRLAEIHGDVTFVFENHGRGASGQPVTCAEILTEVDRPNIRMNFDPINAEHAGTPCLEALAVVRPLVAHVHLKGLAGPGEYCEFGEGLVDLRPVIRSLLSSGYQGRFTVEYEGPHDKTVRLYRGYQEARALIADA